MEKLEAFQVVVCTSSIFQRQIELNEYCHSKGIKFISADTRGLTGMVFCDFGEKFQVTDVNGEEPLSGMIAAVSSDEEGVVTCLDESRHGLQDGDYVTFAEVHGMTQLNACPPRPVKVLGT
jgi:ubiquitin-activating enzyme E1